MGGKIQNPKLIWLFKPIIIATPSISVPFKTMEVKINLLVHTNLKNLRSHPSQNAEN